MNWDEFVLKANLEFNKLRTTYNKITPEDVKEYESLVIKAINVCNEESKTKIKVNDGNLLNTMESMFTNATVRRLYPKIVNHALYGATRNQLDFMKMDVDKGIPCVYDSGIDLNQKVTFYFIGNPLISVVTSISELNDKGIPVDSIYHQQCARFMTLFHLLVDTKK